MYDSNIAQNIFLAISFVLEQLPEGLATAPSASCIPEAGSSATPLPSTRTPHRTHHEVLSLLPTPLAQNWTNSWRCAACQPEDSCNNCIFGVFFQVGVMFD